MKKLSRAMVLAVCLAMIFAAFPVGAFAETVRPVEKDDPAEGHVMIKVKTQALTADKQKMLDRLNEIRYEACQEGVVFEKGSGTTKKLTMADYSELTWSAEMEQVALTRAVEANLAMGHARPNSDDGSQNWGTASYRDFTSFGEILAWGQGIKWDYAQNAWAVNQEKAMMDSIEAWYEEKQNLTKPGTVAGGEKGHYFAIINPDHRNVGLAGAYSAETAYRTSVAGEFLSKYTPSEDQNQVGKTGEFSQALEVQQSNLSGCKIEGVDSLECEESATMSLYAGKVSYTTGVGESQYNDVEVMKPVEWSCGDDGILSIDETGIVKAMAPGTSTITATVNGTKYTKQVKVAEPAPAPAPKTLSADLTKYNAMKISWTKVPEATGYMVYYRPSSTGKYTLLTKTSSTFYSKIGLQPGKKYFVKVVPYVTESGKTELGPAKVSSGIYTLKKLNAPTVSKKSSDKVTVKWNNIAGETGYQISKSTSKSKTGTKYTVKTTSGKSKVLSVKKYRTYYYKVRAYRSVDGKNIYAPWSPVKSFKLK